MTRRGLALLSVLATWACTEGGAVPRCEGDTLVRACTERECVEGGYVEGDGRVHQACSTGRCVEANGSAECVADPPAACTHDTCVEGLRVVCGATGYVTTSVACEDGSVCTAGADWAECAFVGLPCPDPAALFCAEGDVYRCGFNGLAGARVAVCTEGTSCIEAGDQTFCGYPDLACPADTGGFCHEAAACTCARAGGFVYEKRLCDDGLTCVEFEFDGSTQAECAYAERPCEPGASTCEPGLLVICGPSGFEIARLDCTTCEEATPGKAECR